MGTPGDTPTVPGWQVRRELGRGGSSTVWLVEDGRGGQAALKLPDRSAEAPAASLDVELRALGELRHEHVVRPLGVVSTDRGPGLLSEYHAGGSLGSLVRAAGPLPVGQVVTVLVPVAQALQALHGLGVVHGDLSPGNILFTVQGRPAVSDLGSSRLLGGASVRTGTPGFCAPEIADGPDDGHGGLDPAADVYSLAAVGWYALTGRAPARTSSRAPLPLVVPDIPDEVVSLLEAGLAEDPGVRPSAERFALACYRWATAEPVDLYPSASPDVAMELPTRHRTEPARRRRRPVLWAAGTGAALAVAGGVLATGVVGIGADPPVSAPTPGPAGAAASDPATTGLRGTPSPSPPGPSITGPSGTTGPRDGGGTSDVAEAARTLGPARARALASLDREDVRAYSLPDSPAYEADLRLLDELDSRGLRYEDLALRTAVSGPVDRTGPDEARVPLTLTISPYRTVTTAGRTVDEVTRSTEERFTAELVRTGPGWRVERIVEGRGPER
ncbi:serine/threonine-protein kinase [Citricoccus sp.]|uniref:serine/threonine-protein kinase n=1 Tax=Citricoccus sp. TaxID=1978372 RepID=UPI002623CC27|nr:serine/threonine-protein kinase [Citricoccus sp.]HRO29363.1 serine/threonine-protein kinase [Citricoccus sp.]HRO92982.1 serine/threonine-protein kinase [Citricoccus sp.]